jgi:CheY-like chemotaxis protein
MTIERAFEKAKVVNKLIRAMDGVEALELLRGTEEKERLRRPYVVLSDINMPRTDGLNFVEALRNDPDLRGAVIFMLTTSAHDEDKHKAYGLNVAGYIVKTKAGEGFLEVVNLIGGDARIVELE